MKKLIIALLVLSNLVLLASTSVLGFIIYKALTMPTTVEETVDFSAVARRPTRL